MSRTRSRLTRPALAALMLALACAAPLRAADKPAAADPKAGDAAHQAAMAEMMKYAMPGPAHELLQSMAGTWDATVKAWNAPGEPQVTQGVSENRLVLGGRYLEQRYTGSMFGQPFEGFGLTGYDNRRRVYTNVWMDNWSTEMLAGDGSWDPATKTMTARMNGTGPDGKPMPMRNVTRILDADTHVFSMYSPMDGKDALMMEITYKRRK